MNAKSSLCMHLLKGEVLNVRNCFSLIGLTNCAREISRMIEKPFGVMVSRTNMEGVTRYGSYCTWVNYRLNNTEANAEGRKKMIQYLNEQMGNDSPRTHQEEKNRKLLDQINLF